MSSESPWAAQITAGVEHTLKFIPCCADLALALQLAASSCTVDPAMASNEKAMQDSRYSSSASHV